MCSGQLSYAAATVVIIRITHPFVNTFLQFFRNFFEAVKTQPQILENRHIVVWVNALVIQRHCKVYMGHLGRFTQGGYEVISSHFTDTLEKTVMDASLEMLGKF